MTTVQSLKEIGLKATLPRRRILELFEASKVRHLSAEDVYKALMAEGMDVGLATVYRVLTQFEQAGLLARQHFETGKAVFELNQGGHHDHLVCLQCGRVEEFYDSEIEKRQQARLLELRENPVNGGKSDVHAFRHQRLVYILGGEMAHLARLEQFEDPAPGQGRLEADLFQALDGGHPLSL